eukprot:675308-Alexandrium_andersonii.AAC.1
MAAPSGRPSRQTPVHSCSGGQHSRAAAELQSNHRQQQGPNRGQQWQQLEQGSSATGNQRKS